MKYQLLTDRIANPRPDNLAAGYKHRPTRLSPSEVPRISGIFKNISYGPWLAEIGEVKPAQIAEVDF